MASHRTKYSLWITVHKSGGKNRKKRTKTILRARPATRPKAPVAKPKKKD